VTNKFGQLNSEIVATENQTCRDIVKEILNFGVNQRQLLYIIRLIALELENLDDTREIIGLIDSLEKNDRLIDLGEKESE
jgi:hypothetical protein